MVRTSPYVRGVSQPPLFKHRTPPSRTIPSPSSWISPAAAAQWALPTSRKSPGRVRDIVQELEHMEEMQRAMRSISVQPARTAAYPTPHVPYAHTHSHVHSHTQAASHSHASTHSHVSSQQRSARAPVVPVAQAARTPVRATGSVAHLRAPDDAHYPYRLARKKRTKMRASVCVWCVTEALLEPRERPPLRVRASGTDADWERWMREVDGTFWSALTRDLLPMRVLRRLDPGLNARVLFEDLAGAILERLLRELRGADVPQRDLMAQVRSAKAHKVVRFANMIEHEYAKSA